MLSGGALKSLECGYRMQGNPIPYCKFCDENVLFYAACTSHVQLWFIFSGFVHTPISVWALMFWVKLLSIDPEKQGSSSK